MAHGAYGVKETIGSALISNKYQRNRLMTET